MQDRNFEAHTHLAGLLARRPVMLAPMEDVTDVHFRALCREMGADLTFTEFVNVEMLLAGAPSIRRKIALGPAKDRAWASRSTAPIPRRWPRPPRSPRLRSRPWSISTAAAGCPRSPAAAPGAAGCATCRPWRRWPRAIVRAVALPVTVKTRIGWGDSPPRPDEMARRLEDAGVRRDNPALPHRAAGARGPRRLVMGGAGARGREHPRHRQRRRRDAQPTCRAPSTRPAAPG